MDPLKCVAIKCGSFYYTMSRLLVHPPFTGNVHVHGQRGDRKPFTLVAFKWGKDVVLEENQTLKYRVSNK